CGRITKGKWKKEEGRGPSTALLRGFAQDGDLPFSFFLPEWSSDMTSKLLITNGQVFTLGEANAQLPNGAIYCEGDSIVEVGETAVLSARYPGAERLDAGGKVVLPGMLCGHTHFYGLFSRGMAIPGAP